ALAAELGRARDADPATLDELIERLLVAGRCLHAAVGMALAALGIADAVERRQHLLGELAGLAEHRLDEIGCGVGESRQVVLPLDMQDVVDDKHDVVDGSLIGRHGDLLAAAATAAAYFEFRPGAASMPSIARHARVSSSMARSISFFWRASRAMRSLNLSRATLSCVTCPSPR